jgi:hypothetical protein
MMARIKDVRVPGAVLFPFGLGGASMACVVLLRLAFVLAPPRPAHYRGEKT